MKNKNDNTIKIMEVGPRDGLQNESVVVDTASKLGFIEALADAGCKRIEITAFVSPKWIPPLADQVEVARGVKRKPGVVYAALVPNMKGYERAIQCDVDEVSFVIAATDSHNQKNINATTHEAFERYAEVAERANADKIPFRAYVSCAFGCPYEGKVDFSKVTTLSKKLYDIGAYEIAISDTIGVGNPKQTKELVGAVSQYVPIEHVALHLHDTRGTALVNAFAGFEVGVRSFDSSAGGLGGCPYAKGASGNLASEDLIYMLHEMGLQTHIDLDALCEVSLKVEKLLGRLSPSKVLAAYRSKEHRR